ncbi:MAG: hypothetical protein ABFD12_02735 [Syntrophorhabdus sp.]
MASLIDNILSLEQEADRIIEEARFSSKNVLQSADDQFSEYREKQMQDLEDRLEQHRQKLQADYDEYEKKLLQEHSKKLKSIEQLSDDFISNQVNKIIDRFNNW